ncbi:MAG: hypothetical protein AB7P07_07860 [Hyphomonadaceae bacterium]
MSDRKLALPLLLALGAAGCATNPTATLDTFAQRSANNSFEVLDREVDPPSTLVLPVVHDRQTQGPSCGAHALASVINYWKGAGTVTGDALFSRTPPANAQGYSLAELMTLARANGLMASGVRIGHADIIRELEAGRPVLAPIKAPSVFLQPWALPGANERLLGLPSRIVSARVGWISETTGMAMLDHYVLVVGYENDQFIVLEPINGFRTISAERLERYREPFGDAAIVFSAQPPQSAQAPAPQPG